MTTLFIVVVSLSIAVLLYFSFQARCMVVCSRRSLLSGLKTSWVAFNIGGSALWPVRHVGALDNNFSAAASSDTRQTTSTMNTSRKWGVLEPVNLFAFPVYRLYMQDDGTFPNNPDYPLILVPKTSHHTTESARASIINAGWTQPWAWGIFPYHHYHSNAWELLLCVQGMAHVQLGGNQGPTTTIRKGDLLLIPPGFAHKQLEALDDFTLLGSYPPDSPPVDVLRGVPTARQRENIRQCKPPKTDPLLQIELSQLF